MARPPEFDTETVRRRFDYNAEQQCECHRCQLHNGRCDRKLRWEMRSTAASDAGWQAHHLDPDGGKSIVNCRVLCVPCHKETRSYGAH
jgi:hypothetical protein